MIRRFALVVLVTAAVAEAQAPRRRAILVSFDGLSEGSAKMFADPSPNAALSSMFGTAACSEGSRPAAISVTPSGHAAIWTGVYSNVNGVSAIANGALPLSQTTILESTDGYRSPALSAEPIWLSVARQGKRVFSHMATQSPGPPGYLAPSGPNPELDRKRADAAIANQRWELASVNIYNERVAEAQMINEATHPPRVASPWRGLASLGAKPPVTTREVSWPFGPRGDSVHALLVRGSDGVGGVVVSKTRDVERGVFARVAATDTSRSPGRELARHFSSSLRIDLPTGGRTFIFARLFELSPDLSKFSLFISEARVIQGNRPEVARDYDLRVEGVPGSGAYSVLGSGGFGTTIARGGDGTAELRYLETAELVTKHFIRGMQAGWGRWAPDLMVDYLPYPDEALHNWYGLAHPSTPGVTPAARANAERMLRRAYDLVDRRLIGLKRLADATPGTMLFVTGEHGMRPTWLSFRPNVLLRDAGLLAADSSGTIDLSHTVAAATRGGWISVNRDTRKGGIVPRDSVHAVLARVERALLAGKDSTGANIVTQIWRADSPAGDSLGMNGPTGGDLYFAVAPGYYPEANANGVAVSPRSAPRGEHGFASTDRDMWPTFCALGVGARRIGPMRLIDIAPTISEWLGAKPPADSRGRSVLKELRGR